MAVTVRTALTLSQSDTGEPEVVRIAEILDEDGRPVAMPHQKRTPAHELKEMVAFCLQSSNARLALAVTSPLDEQAYSTQRTREGAPPKKLQCASCNQFVQWADAPHHFDEHFRAGHACLCLWIQHSRWAIAESTPPKLRRLRVPLLIRDRIEPAVLEAVSLAGLSFARDRLFTIPLTREIAEPVQAWLEYEAHELSNASGPHGA